MDIFILIRVLGFRFLCYPAPVKCPLLKRECIYQKNLLKVLTTVKICFLRIYISLKRRPVQRPRGCSSKEFTDHF